MDPVYSTDSYPIFCSHGQVGHVGLIILLRQKVQLAFPNLLTDCMPSCDFNEDNMLRQEVFWMMMTCTINQQDVMWGKLNFSVLSWGYITSLCRGLGIVPSKKKLVSAALSLDEYFFLIHRKKRGAS